MDLLNYTFENQEIRTLLIDNEPYFVGKDVADVLGYKRTADAVRQHVNSKDKGVGEIQTPGGTQSMTLVNESGLYALVFGSKLDSAIKFQRWVTSEVLPSIRKHGGYLTPETLEQALLNPDTLIQLATTLKNEREKNELLEQQIAEYEPMINYLDIILSSTDTVTITQIAADYDLSAQALNKKLNELRVQRKVGGQWILFKNHMNQGYTKSETFETLNSNGGIKVVMSTKWTQKGRLFLYELLKNNDVYPQMDLEVI